MPTSHPLQLLDLPSEILTSIYELCVDGIEAYVEQPPKRFIQKRRKVLSRRYTEFDGGHHHRFVFRSDNGTEIVLGLLGVCKRMREEAIQAVAGTMPLTLAISSYAPSITTPPENIVPSGWTERVKELRIKRFLGCTAAYPDLLSHFKSITRATIVWSHTHTIEPGVQPWLRASYGHHASYKHWAEDTRLHGSLRCELTETLGKLLGSVGAKTSRNYRLGISLRLGAFAKSRETPTPAPDRYTAIVRL